MNMDRRWWKRKKTDGLSWIIGKIKKTEENWWIIMEKRGKKISKDIKRYQKMKIDGNWWKLMEIDGNW